MSFLLELQFLVSLTGIDNGYCTIVRPVPLVIGLCRRIVELHLLYFPLKRLILLIALITNDSLSLALVILASSLFCFLDGILQSVKLKNK